MEAMSFENPQTHSIFQQHIYGCQYIFNFIHVIVCVCVYSEQYLYIVYLCGGIWEPIIGST